MRCLAFVLLLLGSFIAWGLPGEENERATKRLLLGLYENTLTAEQAEELLQLGADVDARTSDSKFEHEVPVLMAMRARQVDMRLLAVLMRYANLNVQVRCMGRSLSILGAFFQDAPLDSLPDPSLLHLLVEHGYVVTPVCVQEMRIYAAALEQGLRARFEEEWLNEHATLGARRRLEEALRHPTATSAAEGQGSWPRRTATVWDYVEAALLENSPSSL